MRLLSFSCYLKKAACAVTMLGLTLTVFSCGEEELPMNRCLPTQEQKMEQKVKDIEGIKKYFAENNIAESQFQKTESGIFYQIKTQGSGAQVKTGQTVQVHYIGRHLCKDLNSSSCIFDESYTRGKPIFFVVDSKILGESVIDGWNEAIKLLKVGDEARIFIPSYLAYGVCGSDNIYPNESLMFDMRVISVE